MKYLTSLFLCILLLTNCNSKDQQLDKTSLNQALTQLGNWHYEDETDLDSLLVLATFKLDSVLIQRKISADDSIHNLEIATSNDGQLTAYTFGYHSGGTRGMVNQAILQFKTSKGRYITSPTPIAAYFYDIYALPSANKDLYLLIGAEQGSSQIYQGVAWVVDLSGERFNINYQGFEDEYNFLNFYDDIFSGESGCIACIEFDTTNHTLSIESFGNEDELYFQSTHQENIPLDLLTYQNLMFQPEQNCFVRP